MRIGVGVEIRLGRIEHGLELQHRLAIGEEVTPVETRVGRGLDDLPDLAWNGGECLWIRVIGHPELKHGASLAHASVIAHARFQDVGVTHDELLAGEAAQSGALHTDVLDGPLRVTHGEEVANSEGLVEGDRQRGQQIAEHRLHGECDGDTADAEAGEQRLDLHAEVVERE